MSDGSLIFDTKINKSGFKVGLAALGISLGAVATQVTKVGTEFDTSFAKASTLFGDVAVDTDNLNSKILEMSKSTGVAASELNESLYQAMSAGVPVTENMEEALGAVETASKLAKGGFTDSATAMDVLTTAVNAYGMEASDMNNISDMLVKTQNLGKTTVGELGSTLGQVIPIASSTGVSMENLSASMAIVTKNGVNTAEAGTAVRGMLNELSDSGSDVAGILKEKTGKSFTELMESGMSLGDVLKILQDSVGGDSTAFKNLWGNIRASTGATVLANAGTETFNETLKEMANCSGTTDEAVSKMAGTVQSRFNKIKTRFTNLGISLFQKIQPYLVKLLDAFITMFDGIMEHSDIIKSVLKKVLSVVKFVVDGFVRWLPVLGAVFAAIMVYKTIATVIAIIDALRNGTILAAIAQKFWNLMIALNPLALLITAIVAVVAMILFFVLKNKEAREKIINAWNAVKKFFSSLNTILPKLIKKAMQSIINIIAKAGQGMRKAGSKLIAFLKDGIGSKISAVISFVAGIPKKIIAKFKNMFSKMKETGKHIIDGLWQGIKNAFEGSLIGKVGGLVGKLIKKINKKAGVNSPSIYTTYTGKMLGEGVLVGWKKSDPFKHIGRSITANEWTSKMNGASGIGSKSVVNNNNQTINFYDREKSPLATARAIRQTDKHGLAGAK